MAAYRILFCASEAYPLIKTGGLADVAGSLSRTLNVLGHDVRLVLPAYRDVYQVVRGRPRLRVETRINDYMVAIYQTSLPGTRVPVWLVDCPALYDRPGNPYHNPQGKVWPDNAQRFALFCQIISLLAQDKLGLDWRPDILHANDWQTGLVPALLDLAPQRPATVFTIHNLAYQGIFDRQTFEQLNLPEYLWHYERLEYHEQFSFIKGGINYADRINTVSPTYAREIQTPAFGHGMEGLLYHRRSRLSGIINGIDTRTWNPGTDRLIARTYNRQHLQDKQANKRALQEALGLPVNDECMLMGLVSRLAEQKGIDLLLDLLPRLPRMPVQLVVVGTGEQEYEKALLAAARDYPEHVAVHIGYDEKLAHQVEAGADVFLMPSRFEPCGLNQMYSQRYGTVPIVSPVGGLVDSVIDANQSGLAADKATGFVMDKVTSLALLTAIEQAIDLFANKARWQKLQQRAMQQDFSWEKSAAAYAELYARALLDNPKALR